jgi:general secretion pathway protein D
VVRLVISFGFFMTSSKHVFSLAVFAACQLAVAQTPAPVPAPAPAKAPASQSQGAEDAGKSVDSAGFEPRYIRGDDRVIAPSKAVSALSGPPISLNFEEAPVAEVVRTILGDLLRVDYVLYQPINGTVTLSTRAPVSPDQAVYLLEGALFANGLALTRDARGSYHVGRPEALKGVTGGVRQASGTSLPPGSGAIVVPLQYIGAAEMAAILRPMLPADSLVRVDNVRNLLILAGSRAQAEGWLDLVNTFDVNLLKGMSVGVFPLKHVSVQEVEAALQLMAGGAVSPAGGSTAARASAAPGTTAVGSASGSAAAAARTTAAMGEGNPLFGALRVMPIERLNSILVVTPRAAYLDEVRRWIERFDRPSDNSGEPQLNIYRVQNGNARHLASVLQGIFGGASSGAVSGTTGVAPGLATASGTTGGFGTGGLGSQTNNRLGGLQSGGQGGLGGGGLMGGLNRNVQNPTAQQPVSATIGNIRVMSDDLNNTVLVWGTRSEFAKIEATLKRLDLPPTQVLIEASIIEVTLTDDLRYGLQWAFNDSRTTTGYTGAGQLSSSTDSKSQFAIPTSGFSYTLRNGAGAVRAVLSALSSKTNVKVVASPSLMVLDNHQAAIAVGSQVPVQTATITSLNQENPYNNSTSTYQWKDTGVNLVVTPSVNSGNLVSMQIDQSVTDVGAADDVTKQRAFLQRQLSSKVAVRSGESIVMGGLIQERSSTGKSGIPILHTLPVVGALFGSTTNDGGRTELLVVITPRVVRSDIDVREVSEDLRERMKGLVPAMTNMDTLKTAPAPAPALAPTIPSSP